MSDIQRWDIDLSNGDPFKSENGDWIEYADHLAAMNDLAMRDVAEHQRGMAAAVAAARAEAVNDHEADLIRMASVAFAVGEDGERSAGFAAGVKAARDAVVELIEVRQTGGLQPALAAIDALRGESNG